MPRSAIGWADAAALSSAAASAVRALVRQRPSINPSPADILAIIDKMVKQRRESIAHFEKAGRNDLADGEKAEIAVLSAYLPQQLSEAEVAQAIEAAIAETGAQGAKEMGKVMGLLKPRLAGRTDMGKVSGLLKAKLGA